MGYGYWKPHVPVARRRAQAEKALAKAKKTGQDMQPVVIEGRAIAKTFWGKAWCDNLEAYGDYENRLPRGRAYVRNGAVIDLKIEPGKVRAWVMGSSLYQVEIGIAAVTEAHWKSLAQACTGSIASLVELLQGKLSKAVMERICQPRKGLFPEPKDIRFDCSCPDWATMCKHVAAVLYGVGARLDAQPEILFTLRQVDANDLVTQAAELSVATRKTPAKGRVLDDARLAEVFGIEMDAPEVVPETKKKAATRRKTSVQPPASAGQTPAGGKEAVAARATNATTTDTRPRKVRMQAASEQRPRGASASGRRPNPATGRRKPPAE